MVSLNKNGEVAREGISRVVNTRRPSWPIGSMWKGVSLLLLFLATVQAQHTIVLDTICSCAPGAYEFTLDFSLSCPPVNITIGDAVTDTSCSLSPSFNDPTASDLVPVAVNSIDILELNQDLEISKLENIARSFGDGDTFQFISSAAVPGEIVDPIDIPRALQLIITGVNQFDQEIINVYLIIFSNNCASYPVLFEGQYAGWTRFTDLQPPHPGLCPAVPTPPPTVRSKKNGRKSSPSSVDKSKGSKKSDSVKRVKSNNGDKKNEKNQSKPVKGTNGRKF